VTVAVWDQTDLNENQGSDILEFVKKAVVEARSDSPVAVAARLPEIVSLFWIGTNDRVRTIWSTNVGQLGTPDSGPTWLAAGFELPNTLRVRAGSPLAAASIHDQHIGVYAVGPDNMIVTQCWNGFGAGWLAAARITGPWSPPVTALAAERRDNRIFLYWVDNSGAIWECAVDDQNVASNPVQVQPAGQVSTGSNLVAISRQTDQMDLFSLDPAGHVISRVWTSGGGWGAPFDVASGRTAVLPGSVAAVHVGESRMQVFWEESGQQIWSSWWAPRPDGVPVLWSRPVVVAPVGATLGGGDMVAVARGAGHIRLFFIDNAGMLAEVFWGTTP
jgi:hypothetical protein